MGRKNSPRFIIIHHTNGSASDPLADTSHHTFEIVNEWHRQLWNFKSSFNTYIGYHYFIDRTGKVTQGRHDLEEGAHCKGLNTTSIGICLAGNFDRPDSYPTLQQQNALKRELERLTAKHSIPLINIVPHRRFAAKTCYGRNLSDDWARNLLEPEDEKKELLEKQIEIIKQLIKVYYALIAFLKGEKKEAN